MFRFDNLWQRKDTRIGVDANEDSSAIPKKMAAALPMATSANSDDQTYSEMKYNCKLYETYLKLKFDGNSTKCLVTELRSHGRYAREASQITL